MGNYFGIGVGLENIALGLKIGAQFGVILDDAVVHDRDLLSAHVRMRVALGGHTVRRPARMRDTEQPLDLDLVEQLLQLGDLADRTDSLQMGIVLADRDAGRVVATVFEPSQSLHQDRDDIAFGDGADYAAHRQFSNVRRDTLPSACGA